MNWKQWLVVAGCVVAGLLIFNLYFNIIGVGVLTSPVVVGTILGYLIAAAFWIAVLVWVWRKLKGVLSSSDDAEDDARSSA